LYFVHKIWGLIPARRKTFFPLKFEIDSTAGPFSYSKFAVFPLWVKGTRLKKDHRLSSGDGLRINGDIPILFPFISIL
jgi:hypothetical protein